MHTQREFFQDAADPMADVVFVDCMLTDAAESLSPSGSAAPRDRWSWTAIGSRPSTSTRTVQCRQPWL